MSIRTKRILFIVTSVDRIGPNDRKTGYEFSEVARAHLAFAADGHVVEFASLAGGTPPEDGYDPTDSASSIFRHCDGFRSLNASAVLADMALDDYDAIFFPGGLGPMIDLRSDPIVKEVIAHVYESGRVVGAVCHGPAALLDVALSDGSNFLAEKRVTAFTEAEERGHSEHDVPFMLDVELRKQGARFTHADPFQENVVTDGRLVTGQNPASAAGVAHAMIRVLAGSTETPSTA